MPKIRVAEWKLVNTSKRGERIVIKDEAGRLWERYDDMPIGTWGEVVLPDDPGIDTCASVQQTRKKRAAKR